MTNHWSDWFKDMPSEEWQGLVDKAIFEVYEDIERDRWQQAGLVGKAKILLRSFRQWLKFICCWLS